MIKAASARPSSYLYAPLSASCPGHGSLAQGLHVMCEKPAGVYTKAVREMNEAAKKSGRVFAMMFNQRTNCVYRKCGRWSKEASWES